MPEGLQYVIAVYAVTGATLALWFVMIVAKLRRHRAAAPAAKQSDPAT